MTIFKYALDHPETLEQNTTYSNPPPQRIYQDDNTQHESNYHSLNPRFKTIIAFHPRIDQSKAFENLCKELDERNIIAKHIDGKTNGLERSSKIEWFKEDSHDDDHIFKVLTNVRCLSEGVDIPALDAICFFNKKSGTKNRTRTSLIQAVGRVMRKHKDKSIGYVIVPVVLEKVKQKEVIFEHDYRLTDSSYRNLIEIINSLAAHDPKMRQALEEYKLSKREKHLLGLIKIIPTPRKPIDETIQDDPIKEQIIEILEKAKPAIYACIAKAQGRVKN